MGGGGRKKHLPRAGMQRAGTHVEAVRDRVVPTAACVGHGGSDVAQRVPRGAHGSVCEPHGGSYTAHGIASVNQVEPMAAPAGTPGAHGGAMAEHAGVGWGSCRLMAVHMQPT
eukprot:gene8827-biopygen1838